MFCVLAFVWGYHARSEHDDTEELIEKVENAIRKCHYDHAVLLLQQHKDLSSRKETSKQ